MNKKTIQAAQELLRRPASEIKAGLANLPADVVEAAIGVAQQQNKPIIAGILRDELRKRQKESKQ